MSDFWKNLTSKQKIQLTLTGGILLLFIAYQFSIKNTVQLYQQYRHNKNEIIQAQSAPGQIQSLQQQLGEWERNYSQKPYDREYVFEQANTFCRNHQLSLNHFHPEHCIQNGEYELITNQIDVSGDYRDIVQLAYALEYQLHLGYLASSSFKIKKDRRRRKSYLIGSLYLQHLEIVKPK